MDLYDLANFYKFFKNLYSEQTISPEIVSHLITKTRTDHWRNESSAQWWNYRCRNIQKHPKAQKRKAAAEDELLNKFLKCVTDDTKSVVLKVFNECLTHGIYPSNMVLITPPQRKGDRSDPNIYRAIAVGSNLGKLFSSILQESLITFRSTYCPDISLGLLKKVRRVTTIVPSTPASKSIRNRKRACTPLVRVLRRLPKSVWHGLPGSIAL